jgi:hypothetical protein
MHHGAGSSAPTALTVCQSGSLAVAGLFHQAVSSRTSPVEDSQARRDSNLSPPIRPDSRQKLVAVVGEPSGRVMSNDKRGGDRGGNGRLTRRLAWLLEDGTVGPWDRGTVDRRRPGVDGRPQPRPRR